MGVLLALLGLVGVVKNAHGNWLSGFVVNLGLSNCINVEALGLFYGLSLVKNMRFERVMVEFDSTLIIFW